MLKLVLPVQRTPWHYRIPTGKGGYVGNFPLDDSQKRTNILTNRVQNKVFSHNVVSVAVDIACIPDQPPWQLWVPIQ